MCTACEKTLNEKEFSPSKHTRSGLQSWCKRCKRERGREANRIRMRGYKSPTRAANVSLLAAYKAEHGCSGCGERDPVVLDFHHKDPANKVAEVSQLISSTHKMLAEIAKCIVLCANCHRRSHVTKSA